MEHRLQLIKKRGTAFDQKAERFIFNHPFWGFIGVFIGVPIFTLIAVGAATTIVALPILWLLGWL